LESRPLISSKHEDKSWEIERCVEADILVVAGLTGVDIEVNNLLVNLSDVFTLFECSNKGSDVLESSASDKFGGFVLQEPVVYVRELVCLIID
jgi:hypothetical protein|tara:strand:+ start:1429 stop:1707 length:279 start_codon:yes stop_codon:yes gene_type:complete